MTYLIVQIFLCLLIAFILGVLLGWLLWGRARARVTTAADARTIDGDDMRRNASLEADVAASSEATSPRTFDTSATVATTVTPVSKPAAPGLFGPVSTETVDNLKQISGVGPVIEKQLAGIGITTFLQIANLSDEDIQTVQDAINFFPGRIKQEDWKSQAAALHQQKYG